MGDLDKLEELARAATPGPWRRCDLTHVEVVPEPGCSSAGITHRSSRGTYSPADAAFIAAANPQVLLDLIARVRAAEEVVEAARYTVEDRGDDLRRLRQALDRLDRGRSE